MKKPHQGKKPPRVAKPPGQRSASGGGTLGNKSASGSGTLRSSASGSGVLHKKAAAPKKAQRPQKQRKVSAIRQWSPGSDVACCSAEAYGALVIASGRPWSAEQTLALYWSTARTPDAGASILATLTAAHEGRQGPGADRSLPFWGLSPAWVDPWSPGARWQPPPLHFPAASLILGVTLPEPHAVAVTPDGTWWSWGQPFDPADWPELVVEEAWAVTL